MRPATIPFRPRPTHDVLAIRRYDARRIRGMAKLLGDAGRLDDQAELMRAAKQTMRG